MGKVDLIIFDLAGTTIKDDHGVVNQAFGNAFEAHGISIPFDLINKYMGTSKPVAITAILGDKKIQHPHELVDKIHQSFIQLMIEHYQKFGQEIEGTSEVFKKLHDGGVKVAVDTGFSSPITNAILGKVGWGDLVSSVVSSDQVALGRPMPMMIQKIMAELGITDPARVAKCGDTPFDLMEGQNAKCGMVIGVYEGSHTKSQLKSHYHTHLVPNINYIPDIVL